MSRVQDEPRALVLTGKAAGGLSRGSNLGSAIAKTISLLFAPVAGPTWMKVAYLALVWACLCWFIYNFVLLIDHHLKKKVTTVETTYLEEIPFPDIYLCMPPNVAFHTWLDKSQGSENKATVLFNDFYVPGAPKDVPCSGFMHTSKGCATKPLGVSCAYAATTSPTDGCTAATDMSALPLSYIRPGSHDACTPCLNSCAYFTSNKCVVMDAATRQFSGGSACQPSQFAQPCSQCRRPCEPGNVNTTSAVTRGPWSLNNNAANLARVYGTQTISGIQTSAYCFAYLMREGFSAHADEENAYMHGAIGTTLTASLLAHGSMFDVYVTPPGKAPLNDDLTLAKTARRAKWPGWNSKATGLFSVTQMKDETEGDTNFVNHYNVAVEGAQEVQQFLAECPGQSEKHRVEDKTLVGLGLGNSSMINEMSYVRAQMYLNNYFQFETHVVEKVTIRYVTTAETWAAVGGLYAGCMLIISLLFRASGKFDKDGMEVMIFRYLSASRKDAWLAEFEKAHDKNTHEEKMAELIEELNAARGEASEAKAEIAAMREKLEELDALVRKLAKPG